MTLPNQGLQRSLNEFDVSCSHRELGCEWVGKLGNLDGHLNADPQPDFQLIGCKFVEIECIHCKKHLRRLAIAVHQRERCPKRPYTCEYCEDYESTFESVNTQHYTVCWRFLVPCPNKCTPTGSGIERQDVEHHVQEDCPLTIVDCSLRYAGCEVRLPRKDLENHMREDSSSHVSLLAAENQRIIKQQLEKDEQIQKNFQQLTQENADLRGGIDELKGELAQHQQHTTELLAGRVKQDHAPMLLTNFITGLAFNGDGYQVHAQSIKNRAHNTFRHANYPSAPCQATSSVTPSTCQATSSMIPSTCQATSSMTTSQTTSSMTTCQTTSSITQAISSVAPSTCQATSSVAPSTCQATSSLESFLPLPHLNRVQPSSPFEYYLGLSPPSFSVATSFRPFPSTLSDCAASTKIYRQLWGRSPLSRRFATYQATSLTSLQVFDTLNGMEISTSIPPFSSLQEFNRLLYQRSRSQLSDRTTLNPHTFSLAPSTCQATSLDSDYDIDIQDCHPPRCPWSRSPLSQLFRTSTVFSHTSGLCASTPPSYTSPIELEHTSDYSTMRV